MVRVETSISSAIACAVIRPRACNSIRTDRRRPARMTRVWQEIMPQAVMFRRAPSRHVHRGAKTMETIAAEATCAVVELRQYTLHPGQRDVLISLFESKFVDPLEQAGMTVMGQFHDLDRPDHFVWMRGFADMYQRARGLAAFYGGPVWHAHRESANATMIDSDNVLLLRPARDGTGITLGEREHTARSLNALARGRIVVTINPLARPARQERTDLFETALAPACSSSGASA